jgi:hypothetical protein
MEGNLRTKAIFEQRQSSNKGIDREQSLQYGTPRNKDNVKEETPIIKETVDGLQKALTLLVRVTCVAHSDNLDDCDEVVTWVDLFEIACVRAHTKPINR